MAALAVGAVTPRALHAAPKIPRPAGEAIITLSGGSLVKLSDHKGKVVALEVLLTTCPHCQRCSRTMQKLFEEYGPRGFQPLGGAIDETARQNLAAYTYQLGLKFPVGIMQREMAYGFLQLDPNGSKPVYMPQLVFVDRAGQVVKQFAGTDDFFLPDKEEGNMRAIIESLLGAKAAAKKS